MIKVILLVFAAGTYTQALAIEGFSSLQACQVEADRLWAVELDKSLKFRSPVASYRCVEVK